MKRVLVVGSLNMDLVVDVEHLPLVGETVLGNQYWKSPGGKGANQAYAAGRAGADVAMLGCVGEDLYGTTMLEKLTEAGVRKDAVRREKQHPTGTAFVLRETSGANSIIVISGANWRCTPAYLAEYRDYFAWADCVLCQLEIPLESVCAAVHQAKELGKTVLLNPAPACPDLPGSLFPQIDVITPNETELAALTGGPTGTLEEIADSAQRLKKTGVGSVVVTMGARGALLVQKDRTVHIPGNHVDCVDTTGAGDCFNGVLAAELAAGTPLEKAVYIANAAASLSVTRHGALQSMPGREEITMWLRTPEGQKRG